MELADRSTAGVAHRATAGDIPALSAMLAAAFADDPYAGHVAPSGAVLRSITCVQLAAAFGSGEVWTVDDHRAAALWLPSERSTLVGSVLGDGVGVAGRLVRNLGLVLPLAGVVPRSPVAAACLRAIERRRPSAPHWHLGMVGTASSARGRGLASSTLNPVLARCDRDGRGAYLECSKEQHVGFYERRGFRTVDVMRLPFDGPPLWLMWRDPADRTMHASM